MTAKSPIVLVHGAWSNGKTWDAVAAKLRALGHRVIVVDLPGHGRDTTPPDQVGLADYGRHIAQVIADCDPVVLVGHSMGGMAISDAAERLPESIRKLVYVAAFLPQDGQSLLDLIKQQDAPGIRDAIRPASANGATILDPELAVDILCQDATPKQRPLVMAALGPQSNRAQTDPACLSPKNFGSVPRTYVICEQDRTVTPALQRLMLAKSPCDDILQLDSGHLPQITQSTRLAEYLSKF